MGNRKIKVEFSMDRGTNRNPLKETVNVVVPENANDGAIEEEIRFQFSQWLFDNVDAGWEIVEE